MFNNDGSWLLFAGVRFNFIIKSYCVYVDM